MTDLVQLTYWDETTQTEKDCYPVVAGQSTRNVGEIIQSSLPLTDAGLHLLDGSLLPYGIYKEFIDYIADLYAENPSANYFTDETTWQASVTQYGVCGKFVYDSTNNTVRLPKVTGKIEGTTDVTALGNLAEQYVKLPNITGSFYAAFRNSTTTGAFTMSSRTEGFGGNNNGSGSYNTFDASRVSTVYSGSGTDTEIHEQAIKMFVYIVIATSTKTDIQVDIDEIATDLNGKADTDLENTTTKLADSFLSKIMPDYENQITGSGGNWVQCSKDSFICIWGDDPFTEDYYCYVSPDNGTTTYIVGRRYDDTNGNTEQVSFTFFCPKNWYFRCTSEHTPSYCIYPLKGAN